jgi:hypothetical protein
MGAEVWLLFAGALGAWWLADRWVKQAKAPPTSLRCNNCPKLAQQIRMRDLALVLVTLGWAGTFIWGLSR